jgi:hypothetical protein
MIYGPVPLRLAPSPGSNRRDTRDAKFTGRLRGPTSGHVTPGQRGAGERNRPSGDPGPAPLKPSATGGRLGCRGAQPVVAVDGFAAILAGATAQRKA